MWSADQVSYGSQATPFTPHKITYIRIPSSLKTAAIVTTKREGADSSGAAVMLKIRRPFDSFSLSF